MRAGPVQCRRPRLSPPQARHSSGPRPAYYVHDMEGSHAGAVAELDLSACCHPNSIVDRINAMPGLKTSTAFFTFLRANLVLPHSAMSSNVSTPSFGPLPSQPLPSMSSPLAASPQLADLDDDIPPLSLDVLTQKEDKVHALELVADSIAQQRQQAAFHLVFHPLPLATLLAVLGVVCQRSWVRQHDLGTTLLLASGIVMTYLLAIRYLCAGYLRAAEALSWKWLAPEELGGEEDLVIGTRFGQEIIGALVLRLEPGTSASSSGGNGRRKRSGLRGGRGVIRAWTTKLRFRGRGVGQDMLREAVRVVRERCGRDAEVGFAQEHANSVMVLPEMFNKPFRRGEVKAAKALEAVLAEGKAKR